MLSPFCEKEPLKQYPWLALEEHCRVLIIGGGLCACAAAKTLAEQGKDVVLLSPEPIGNESGNALPFSLQNHILLHSFSPKESVGDAVLALKNAMRAADRAEAFAKAHNLTHARRNLFLAAGEPRDLTKLDEEYRLRLHNGFAVALHFQNELRDRYSFSMKAALELTDASVSVDPAALAQALAADAEQAGARIYEQSEVSTLTYENGKWCAVSNTGRSVYAAKVILTGSHSFDLLNLPKRRLYLAASAPCPDFSGYPDRPVVQFLDHSLSFASDPHDRILTFSEESAALPQIRLERRYTAMEKSCAEALTAVRPAFPQNRAVAVYARAKDGLPFLYTDADAPNLYALCENSDVITSAFALCEDLDLS